MKATRRHHPVGVQAPEVTAGMPGLTDICTYSLRTSHLYYPPRTSWSLTPQIPTHGATDGADYEPWED
jgi:hypothetical protein